MEITHSLINRTKALLPGWAKASLKKLRRNFPDYPKEFIGRRTVDIRKVEYLNAALFGETTPHLWLDKPDFSHQLERRKSASELSLDEADACRYMTEHGYFILRNALSLNLVDAAIEDFIRGQKDGRFVNANGDRRFLNPHLNSPAIDSLLKHPTLVRWVETFLNQPVVPYQSIGSQWGSGQLEHSDAIHMSTYPLGYMMACWVACEDIHPDSGPLVYYPGSHKLPYHLSAQIPLSQKEFRERGYDVYTEKYEPFIQELIRQKNLAPLHFLPKKGDVLFWHHNLIHGGSPIKNPMLTRKSIVFHYFAQGALCYHDLSGGRATFDRTGAAY